MKRKETLKVCLKSLFLYFKCDVQFCRNSSKGKVDLEIEQIKEKNN